MQALFGVSGPFAWLVLGMVLIAIEALIAPGTYLLWIGLAALVMAALNWLMPLGMLPEMLIFGLLALGFALLGWRIVYRGRVGQDAARDLHDPAISLIGRIVPLHKAIQDGHGQIRIDDTIWRVTGPDLPAGEKVRILSLDGTLAKVEPA